LSGISGLVRSPGIVPRFVAIAALIRLMLDTRQT
jgi:hypothetical protein